MNNPKVPKPIRGWSPQQRTKNGIKEKLLVLNYRTSTTLIVTLIICLIALLSTAPQSSFAQDTSDIYLPFVQVGADVPLTGTTPESPPVSGSPFRGEATSDLNALSVALERVNDQQFLILGGESDYSRRALYIHLDDDEKMESSACNEVCKEAWIPYTIQPGSQVAVQSEIANDLNTTQRGNGDLQVTYQGWPLYRYAGDELSQDSESVTSRPVVANGDGIDGVWWRAEARQHISDQVDESRKAELFRSAESVVTRFAEAGTLEVGQDTREDWHTVSLSQRYRQPVVIMQPLSANGGQPATIRVKNVSQKSFQFKIDEWAYLDGSHTQETVHYMVVESGIHTLPNSGGRQIHAGIVDADTNWSTVTLEEPFPWRPVVLSQVQTHNGPETVITRQQGITKSEFLLRLQEDEADDGQHTVEQVGYIALRPGKVYLGGQAMLVGRTPDRVTHRPYTIEFGTDYQKPMLLAAMQTNGGYDPANLRYKGLTNTKATLFISEEQSKDQELWHTTEVVGYIVLSSDGAPEPEPTSTPTPTPQTPVPTSEPTIGPTAGPTNGPTAVPTAIPTSGPTPTSTPPPTAEPGVQTVFIVNASQEHQALEQTGEQATIEIQRTGNSGAATVSFALLADSDPNKGAAEPADYVIRDSSGTVLNNSLSFRVGQMSQSISVEAVADTLVEVPEALRIQLQADGNSRVRPNQDEATIWLRDDAPGVTDSSRLFYGQMAPENGAATTATGWATIRLSNDNSYGLVDMRFNGLTGAQTASHIHYANPLSGPIVHSIPLGQVADDRWNIQAMHGATTDQAMLDALLGGGLYINIHSANYPSGEVRTTMQLKEGAPNFVVPSDPEPIETLSGTALRRDILRFLTQASFGPTIESVTDMEARVASHGGDRIAAYTQWIDEQMTLESPSQLEFLHANIQSFTAADGNQIGNTSARKASTHYLPAWYTSAVYGKAQLRERMAFALSEIFVISNNDISIGRFPWFAASYDDMLSNSAFGSFETLLTDVSKHPAMGTYLSHLKNEKTTVDASGRIISSPDENYAREVMQLFSLGLVEMHPDGSLKLGDDGLPIRTYDQTDISELARVFTGWSFGVKEIQNGQVNSSVVNDGFFYSPYRIEDGGFYKPPMIHPMRMFEAKHDQEQKLWLGQTLPAGQTGEQELAQVMQVLSSHPNTSVFISHQLIQRFVTPNPSAGYLYRTAKVFRDSNGNLGEVVKALLLDPEARNLTTPAAQLNHGKIKEPLLQAVALMRFTKPRTSSADTFNFDRLRTFGYPQSQVALFESGAEILYVGECIGRCDTSFAQAPLFAPSVFNFFLPDFAPTGPVIDAGIVSPELQLLDENNAVGLYNAIYNLTVSKQGFNGALTHKDGRAIRAKVEYRQPQWMVDAYMAVMDSNGNGQIESADSGFSNSNTIRNASAALVDLADDYLCSGELKANATGDSVTDPREIIITGVYDALAFRDGRDAGNAQTARTERIREALYLVSSAPQCTVMD